MPHPHIRPRTHTRTHRHAHARTHARARTHAHRASDFCVPTVLNGAFVAPPYMNGLRPAGFWDGEFQSHSTIKGSSFPLTAGKNEKRQNTAAFFYCVIVTIIFFIFYCVIVYCECIYFLFIVNLKHHNHPSSIIIYVFLKEKAGWVKTYPAFP